MPPTAPSVIEWHEVCWLRPPHCRRSREGFLGNSEKHLLSQCGPGWGKQGLLWFDVLVGRWLGRTPGNSYPQSRGNGDLNSQLGKQKFPRSLALGAGLILTGTVVPCVLGMPAWPCGRAPSPPQRGFIWLRIRGIAHATGTLCVLSAGPPPEPSRPSWALGPLFGRMRLCFLRQSLLWP